MLLAFGIACGVIEARTQRPRPGGRRGDGRRRGAARRRCSPACSPPAAGARSAASTSSTPARPGTTATRRATASSSRSARSSRSSTPSCCERLGLDRRRCRSSTTAPAGRAARALRRAPSQRRTRDEWCAAFEGSRRLLRAGARVHRVAPPSARRGARRRDRARRHRPARAGAALRRARRARRRRPPPERGEGGADGTARLGLRRRGDRGSRRLRRRRRAEQRAATRGASGRARRVSATPTRRLSAATPSSRSFSRWAVSERSAIGCRRGGHVGVDPLEQRARACAGASARSASSTLASRFEPVRDHLLHRLRAARPSGSRGRARASRGRASSSERSDAM